MGALWAADISLWFANRQHGEIETEDVGGAQRENRRKPCSRFKLVARDDFKLHDVDVDVDLGSTRWRPESQSNVIM